MSIDNVLAIIEKNSNKDFNCLSIAEPLPRFSNLVPGIMRGKYYCVTGTPNSAKTQFTDFLFVYHLYDFCRLHKIKLQIVYFSFEINKDAKTFAGLSKRLFTRYGLRISPSALQSINHTLEVDEKDRILEVREYFKELESVLTIYDDPMTPSQIFKVMSDKLKGTGEWDPIKKTFTPNDPDSYTIFIIDHIGLIQPESGQGLHTALSVFSANNMYLRNKFGATIVNVHQQGAEGGVEKFTNKGDKVVGKLEPKLAGLADNRTLGRDYDLVLGLFSPFKHEVDFYRGYKIKRLEDRCRFLSIVKNRDGVSDLQIGLYFDGAVGYFEELPKPEEFTIIRNGTKVENDQLYEKYHKGQVALFDPDRQRRFKF